ncbi:hypothetical protein ND16A_1133 [Thalassotalea sp. ND16A]|nr:hypothetical protein ND16A_1133 [Thalassotalea sp. ND16A]
MIDSLYYIVDVGCLMYLFFWATSKDNDEDSNKKDD